MFSPRDFRTRFVRRCHMTVSIVQHNAISFFFFFLTFSRILVYRQTCCPYCYAILYIMRHCCHSFRTPVARFGRFFFIYPLIRTFPIPIHLRPNLPYSTKTDLHDRLDITKSMSLN